MSESSHRPPTTESFGPTGPEADEPSGSTEFDDLVRARYRTLPRAASRSGTGSRDAIGTMVGSVRLEVELGTGGMGRVFRGHDERLDRKVAVKTVLHRKRHRRGARARLRREARLLSRINHPRICQLYDLVETDYADYLILELVEGENLGELLARGTLTRSEGLAYAEEIAEALVVAHRRGIVHRDLKPDNVMITPRRGVKVLDFGIARSPDGEAIGDEDDPPGPPIMGVSRFETVRGAVIGTAAYMSPEQARGEPVTPASDIYSFGVLLEEMLSGEAPVPEGTESQAIIEVVREGQRPQAPAPLPRRFSQLIARLQTTDPGDRPAAAEALASIRRLRSRTRRILRRVAIAVAVVVMAAGVTKYTVDLREQRSRAEQARAQAEALVGFLLEDLHEGLEPLGRLDLLDRVAQRSLDYFETTSETGRPAAEAEALRQVGGVLTDRGDLEAALSALERARELDASLVKADPRDGDRIRALARDEREIAALYGMRGEGDRAVEIVSSAAERLRSAPASDIESRRELAALLSFELADYHRDLGDVDAAEEVLDEASEILVQLQAERPDDREILVAVGRYHYAHGLFDLIELGHNERALEQFRQAIEVYSRLESLDPLHTDYRYRLAVLHGQGLCSILEVEGRHEEALEACGEALDRLRGLHREDSSNSRWAHALGWEYIRRVELMSNAGESDLALDAARRAVEIHRETARRAPDNTDWQGGFAIACQVEAELRAERGELRQAIALLEEARGIQSRFAEHDSSGTWLSELSWSEIELGRLRLQEGEAELARHHFEQALKASERGYEIGSERAVVQADLASNLVSVSLAFIELGDRDEAQLNLERARDLLEDHREIDSLVMDTRALALLLLGETEEAKQVIEAMVEAGLSPGSEHPELLALARDRGVAIP